MHKLGPDVSVVKNNIAFFSQRFTTLRPDSHKTGAAFETPFFQHVSLRSGRGPGKKVRPLKGYVWI